MPTIPKWQIVGRRGGILMFCTLSVLPTQVRKSEWLKGVSARVDLFVVVYASCGCHHDSTVWDERTV